MAHHDRLREVVSSGDEGVLRQLSRGGEAADRLPGALGEPERTVGTGCDSVRSYPSRDRVLVEVAVDRDPTNHVAQAAGVLGEPQRTVGADRDVEGLTARGQGELGEGRAVRVDSRHDVRVGLGEPDVAVRARDDAAQTPSRAGCRVEGSSVAHGRVLRWVEPSDGRGTLGEPEGPVGTLGKSVIQKSRKPRDRVMRERKGGRIECGDVAVDGVGEPERTVGAEDHPGGQRVRGAVGVFGDQTSGGVDLRDAAHSGLGEPDHAVGRDDHRLAGCATRSDPRRTVTDRAHRSGGRNRERGSGRPHCHHHARHGQGTGERHGHGASREARSAARRGRDTRH